VEGAFMWKHSVLILRNIGAAHAWLQTQNFTENQTVGVQGSCTLTFSCDRMSRKLNNPYMLWLWKTSIRSNIPGRVSRSLNHRQCFLSPWNLEALANWLRFLNAPDSWLFHFVIHLEDVVLRLQGPTYRKPLQMGHHGFKKRFCFSTPRTRRRGRGS